ncbi:type II toxin-antitoxin system death-on-curing family toxin [Desertibaculum subflavum]|uniref:type II toxin-antitoxin system death-on-curing family toxin n=1 Tax=Desertibaculum subflavum TaxID=2268458 RepID=UPI000E672C46
MAEFEWLEEAVIIAAHAEQLAEHGGGEGIRDRGLLESALARPRNIAAYGDPDVVTLAAAYGFGIVRNHRFVDGNKRTGLIATELFLELNGMTLMADDEACVLTYLALADGSLSEADLVAWLRAHSARQA